MKHPKKKFKFEKSISEEQLSTISGSAQYFNIDESTKKTKPPKDHDIYLHTLGNTVVKTFHITIHGNHYYIPEPDPILIYFNDAYMHYKNIINNKATFLAVLNIDTESNIYEIVKELYKYFGWCNGFVIFLFTSIEAFLNKMIPINYKYEVVKNNRTEVYNKEQIERHISFDVKYKSILPDITQKDYSKSFPLKHQHIQNLKDFRDIIIHSKTKEDGYTPYDYLFRKSLTFSYEETLNAVRDFFNYYEPNYIEDCDCGADY